MDKSNKIESKNIQDILALTPMQNGMLFYYLHAPQDDSYFNQLSLELAGDINLQYFEDAWNLVLETNEMLRTVFRWEQLETPTQVVLKRHTLHLRYEDLSRVGDCVEQKKQWDTVKQQDRSSQFDLREVPFRVIIGKMAQYRYHMLISNHHILYDGWSTGIILKEFFQAYETLAMGSQLLVPQVKPRFKEFIQWHQEQDRLEQKKFWRNYLEGFDSPSRLPIKRSKPVPGFPGEKNYRLHLSQTIKDKLNVFLKDKRITLATVFYCAWGVLLQKYCGSDDVIFGTTVSGRSAPISGIENIVGLFINTLPLRVTTEPGGKIKELVERINDLLPGREKYENTSLVDIKEYSELQNNQELFDSILVLENYPLDRRLVQGSSQLPLVVKSYSIIETTTYPLAINIAGADTMEIRFIYNLERFETAAICKLSGHFLNVFNGILTNFEKDLTSLELLGEEEKRQILHDFNTTGAEYPRNKTIHDLFADQVKKNPDRSALVGALAQQDTLRGDITITYNELNVKSHRLAHLLIEQGVVPDTLVGIMIERSIDTIVGFLGILKAGGAYLPIDPDYPQERSDYILKDSNAGFLLVAPGIQPQVKVKAGAEEGPQGLALRRINRGEEPGPDSKIPLTLTSTSTSNQASPANLAYIIYTSGTTGRPKGVTVRHGNLVRLFFNGKNPFDFNYHDVWTLFHSPCFDFSAWEMYGALLNGGKLVVIPRETARDTRQFLGILEKWQVTVLNQTPSAFYSLMEQEELSAGCKLSLRYVIFGGETLTPGRLKQWQQRYSYTRLINMFGITETTVHVTFKEITEKEINRNIGNIGRPIPTLTTYILDNYLHPVPIGLTGELWVGGAGVARGYLNRPVLTAERFRENHYKPGEKLYRSGDLAYFLKDGDMVYRGRKDQQVQLRGFRIELGEIENRLLKNKSIKEAVVTAREDKDSEKYLCAYIVPRSPHSFGSSLEMAETLKRHLVQVIPGYMVPSFFILLDKIPLTPNGKVDRRSLPEPLWERGREYTAPRNKTEQTLAGIWVQLLNLQPGTVGIDDDFFHRGGHSLKATLLVSRIHKVFNVNIPLAEIFKIPTIRGLTTYIKTRAQDFYAPIGLIEKKEYYELSSAQRRLYVIQQMDINSTAYNISTAISLKGSADRDKLQDIFRIMIHRHESLRTSFSIIEDEPVQEIHTEVEFEIETYDPGKSQQARGNSEKLMPGPTIKNFIRPFNLSHAPLLRVGLIKRENHNHFLMVDMHHIIGDGISTRLLLGEFNTLMAGKDLPGLKLQYKDYAQWENREADKEKLTKQGDYFRKQLEGGIPVLELPTDFSRPKVQRFEGKYIKFELDQEETVALKTIAQESGATLYMVLLAIYFIFLSKLTNQEDLLVGTPTMGRRHEDLEQIVGMFVNTLVLRNSPLGEKTYYEFLKEIKERSLEAFKNQDYQYEALVEDLTVTRDSSRNPLFDTMFVMQNVGLNIRQIEIPGLKLEFNEFQNLTSKFDLTLIVPEPEDKLQMTIEYSTSLFKEATIKRFITYFTKVLSTIIRSPVVKLADIEILAEVEKKQVLYDFNTTGAEYPRNKTIHDLFEEQVKKTPDRAALVGPLAQQDTERGDITTTYNELNVKSHRLAHLLIERGVVPDTLVGIMIERSIDTIVGFLGILKAGGAYLPIDPDYPQERIDYILKDSGAKLLVITGNLAKEGGKVRRWEGGIYYIEELLRSSYSLTFIPSYLQSSSNLAYSIYTSGTTGKPKGVLLEHKNVVSLLFNDRFQFYFSEADVWTLFHSFGFDFSVWEMYGALLYGGRLVVIPQMTARDPHGFLGVLIDQKVTVLNQTPSAFYNLIDEELKSLKKELCLRYVIFGGEALNSARLKAWWKKYPGTKLVNMFGITETCVHVTYKEIGEIEIEGDISNIGKPIPTLSTYIMDGQQRLVPIGTIGELYVGGEGVARGYLNQPGLTSERFVENSYKTGERLYRSGDMARIWSEGEMVYLGRMDHQVQLRGFRIELGEIENRLLKHEGIKKAVVIERSILRGDLYLCAYIVPQPGVQAVDLEAASIRKFLSRQLPDYMIPSYVVQLEDIPLTPNGKMDRSRLPQPELRIERDHKPPRNKNEEKLVDAWQEVLELESAGTEDNFFDVGGDSIKAIKLISRINERLNSNLKIVDLYTNKTIGELANLIDRKESESVQALYRKVTSDFEELKAQSLEQMGQHDASVVDLVENIYPMCDIEKGMAFYYMKHAGTGIYHDQFTFSLNFKDYDPGLFKWALTLLGKKHEILRTGFNIEEFEEPAHVVYKEPKLNFVLTDLSGLPPDQQREQIRLFIEEDRRNPFEILNPPLWRMHIFTLGNDRIYLIFIFHHAILDGWSVATLMTELHTTYIELKRNPSYIPPGLKSGYKDMVIQERVEKENEWTLRYWQEELEDYIRLDFSETAMSKSELAPMKVYERNAGEEILEQARQVATRWNTHIKNLCFSAYAYMMGMFSYEKDLVVGCVTNNRTDGPDGDQVLGCFLNTVPVRLKIPGNITWKEYVVWVEGKMLEMKKHERLPLFEIAFLMGEKNKDRNPLFDTLFNFTDFHVYRQARIGENGSGIAIDKNDSHAIEGHQDTNTLFDFEVDITMGGLLIHPKYNTAAISDEMVKKCCVYFINILNKYINDPDSPARRDDILLLEEKEKLLYLFNDTITPYSREKTMHMLFAERVEIFPDNIAGVGPSITLGTTCLESVQITYRELNELSNRLAYGLRKMGVGAGDFVGVVMDRCMEMVPAVMGILKAGGAYAPLEPYLPDRRIEKILASLKTKCVVTDSSSRPRLEAVGVSLECLNHIVSLDKMGLIEFKHYPVENPAPVSGSEDISYVIYTSGSTGTPKGVVETHRPVVNVIEWVNKTFEVGEKDKLLFVASLGFDLSVYDIFGILASGGSIRTAGSGDMKDPLRLLEIMGKEGITFWDSAPAALQQLVPFFSEVREEGKITGLRLVFLSGDWIPVSMPGDLRDTFKGVRVISLGGATEATIWSNYYPIGDVDPSWHSIPYGKPIQNATYYILDTSLNLCPINTVGDLYIGGECLAKEYKNDPELTAGKFIDNLFCPGERLYKTGDIARWFEDGNMQFLGRKDHQVKIRGYRIELGEIESQLSGYPGIREAIVIDRKDGSGNKYICAYYTVERVGGKIEKEELISYLSGELPEYMIPSHLISIDHVPVTPNGKLDRNALPEPELNLEESYAAPGDELQEKLLGIWKEVLFERDEEKVLIGIDDDFFELGGHSLNATVVIAKIHKISNVKVPLVELFKTPTIRELSAYIRKASPNKYVSINPAPEKEYYTLSSAQVSLYFVQQMELEGTSYNIPMNALLEGQLDLKKFENVFVKLIERHESLRSSFEMINEELVQKIHKKVDFKVDFKIENYDASEIEDVVKHFIRPFDLSKAPLMRIGLLKQEVEKHILMLDIHHIISDGASMDLLIREFTALYTGEELPRLRLQYRDYAEWQKKEKENGLIKKQEDYWLKQFDGKIPILKLPVDYVRPPIRDFDGDNISFEISRVDTEGLKKCAIEGGATIYMVLLAIFSIMLAKICSQEDIVIGVTPAGRSYVDLESIAGVFPNVLGIRDFPKKEKRFDAFLREVKDTVLQSLENQDYQFDDLVEKVVMERDPGRNPLFDVFFMFRSRGLQELDIPGLKVKPYGIENKKSKYDLELNAWESDGRVVFSIIYKITLFKKDTIKLFQDYLTRIISILQRNQMIKLSEIEMTSHVEEESLFLGDLEGE